MSQTKTLEMLTKQVSILDYEYLTTDDVSLVPKQGSLQSRADATLSPFIYSSPMDTVTGYDMAKAMLSNNHYPVVCRFLEDEWENTLKDLHHNQNVFFAIGSSASTGLHLANKVKEYGIQKLSVNLDVAHGDTIHMHKLYQYYSDQPYVGSLMSGSICTGEAAVRSVRAGCTHLRVGIGPGSACTTRLMTGCGVPQLSAVYNVHKTLENAGLRTGVTIIADGGVRSPGDAVKYLAAGADGIMMGNRFSRTCESSGWSFVDGKHTKRYRGQASASFQRDFNRKSDCPEGATSESFVPSDRTEDIIKEFEGGVRSALSYLGLRNIKDLSPELVEFIKITPSAQLEGTPHGTTNATMYR